MPKVPVLTRRVQPSTLPDVSLQGGAGADAFGGIQAQAIETVGGIVSDVGEVLQRRETALEKDRAEFKEINDKLWADTKINETNDFIRNKRAEYSIKTGLDAFGITDQVNSDLEKHKRSILDTATNPEQKALYLSAFSPKKEAALNLALSYEVTERKKTVKDTLNAARDNAIRDAADIASDPSINFATAQIGIFGKRKELDNVLDRQTVSMTASQAKSVKAETISAFHENILNGKVSLDAENAKQYYENNKKEILPEKRKAIEKTLETEDILQTAQTVSDEIVLSEPDRSKWADMARNMKYTGTDEVKAKKRKEAVDLIKTRKKELNQLDKEAKEATFLDALDKIDTSGSLEEGIRYAKRLDDPIDRAKAVKVAKSKFERKTKDIETDRNVQAKIYDMIDTGQIKSVEQLVEYSPYLSNGDYSRAISEIRSKQGKDAKVGFVKYETAKRAYETVKGVKRDIEDDDQNKEFMYLQSNLDRHAQALGRDLTPDEAIKLTARYIVEGEAIGTGIFGLTDPDMSLFEAIQEDVLDVWAPNVEDTEKTQIKQALKARNIITDDDTILRLYKKEAILNIPLSDKQKKILKKAVEREKRRFDLLEVIK